MPLTFSPSARFLENIKTTPEIAFCFSRASLPLDRRCSRHFVSPLLSRPILERSFPVFYATRLFLSVLCERKKSACLVRNSFQCSRRVAPADFKVKHCVLNISRLKFVRSFFLPLPFFFFFFFTCRSFSVSRVHREKRDADYGALKRSLNKPL